MNASTVSNVFLHLEHIFGTTVAEYLMIPLFHYQIYAPSLMREWKRYVYPYLSE
jgi:hypothetical protein